MSASTTSSSAYRESIRLLHLLHTLVASGRGDTDEADQLRNEMDAPWHQLSESEQDRIRGLAADLYSLEEPPRASPGELQDEEKALVRRFGAELKSERWDEALKTLRAASHLRDAPIVAYCRARCWQGLGDFETAIRFLRRAIELRPTNVSYRCLLFWFLERTDRLAEAIDEANLVLRVPQANDPILVLAAADIKFRSTAGMSPSDRKHVYKELVSLIPEVLDRTQPQNNAERLTVVRGLVELGSCLRALGKSKEALAVYDQAVQLDPTSDIAYVGRAILHYDLDRPSAVSDFLASVSAQTKLVWPYFYLSHFYLTRENYERVLAMTEAGLERSALPRIRAKLYEWRAIAGSMMDMADSEVLHLFDEAMLLDPNDPQLRTNADEFKKWTHSRKHAVSNVPLASTWQIDLKEPATVEPLGEIFDSPLIASAN